jgi:hypothetical protein
MRSLSSGSGTTLIVVSHAVNMLPELCDRIIWIDKGVIRMDGEPETVARAYDAFVRTEEENRLRRLQIVTPIRQMSTLPGNAPDSPTGCRTAPAPDGASGLVGEIRLPDGEPPRDRLVVQRLEFMCGGERVADMPIGADTRAGDALLLTDAGAGNWGTFDDGHGTAGRPFLPYGSPFHKLAFRLTNGRVLEALEDGRVEVRLSCAGEFSGAVDIGLHAPDRRWRAQLTVPPTGGAGARTVMAECRPIEDDVPQDGRSPATASGRYGTRRVELTDIRFLGEDELSRLVFSIGAPFRVAMRYRVNDPALDENAEIVVAFQRDGLQVTNRFFLNEYRFCAGVRREGEIVLDATPLLLAPGEYTASVAVHAAGHATRKTPRDHFSVSQTVYDMYYRCFQISVFEPYHTTLLKDVIFQHPAKWIVDSEEYQKTAITD